jgi:hypothetical protein
LKRKRSTKHYQELDTHNQFFKKMAAGYVIENTENYKETWLSR